MLAWQVWYLETSTCVGVAGVALGDIYLCWRGRRGTWRHLPAFGLAGVALGDIYLRFTWQAWHLETSTCVSRGRRGSWRHLPWFHVARVALGVIYLRFAWQAWHLETSTCAWRGRRGTCCTWWRAWSPLVAVGRPWRRASLRGKRGTWRHLLSFHVAGVALGDIHLRFAWQAWHLATSTFVLRGRRGTWRHPPSFCHPPSLSHTTSSHTIFHTTLSVTHTTSFYFSILRHLVLCLSFLPRPRYNIWCSLLEEVALWGYPVL